MEKSNLFCPNISCENHADPSTKFCISYGKYIDNQKRVILRYRCKNCYKTFSSKTFSFDYKERKKGYNALIFNDHINGMSNSAIARRHSISEHMVRNRLEKISRHCFLKHTEWTKNKDIDEALVYDGLENFAFSQYDINNINHLVGKDSLFMYDFNYSPMNRKGRMSPRQKNKVRVLDKIHGRYPGNSIRVKTTELLKKYSSAEKRLILYSDEHFQYRKSVEKDLKNHLITHIKVSSHDARNYKNHLFAVNNIDMQTRQFIAAFRRETISFSKNYIAMVDKFNIFAFFKNYMRPKFYKKHKREPNAHCESPAQFAGIKNRILKFSEVFNERSFWKEGLLSKEWDNFYFRRGVYSRVKILPFNNTNGRTINHRRVPILESLCQS